MRKNLEHDTQVAFITYISLYKERIPEWAGIYAVPNGKTLQEKIDKTGRSYTRGKYYTDEGLKKGIPDICCPFANPHYSALYIEFKAGKNKLSPDQNEMIKILQNNVNRVIVSRSSDHAIYWLLVYTKRLYESRVKQLENFPPKEQKDIKKILNLLDSEISRVLKTNMNSKSSFHYPENQL